MFDQTSVYGLRPYDQALLSFKWQPDACAACAVRTPSLFPTDMPAGYDGWPRRTEALCPRDAITTFDVVMGQARLPRHAERARRLIDFEFENHPMHPFERARLDVLGRFVQAQARRLLGRQPRDLDAIRRDRPSVLDVDGSPMLAVPTYRRACKGLLRPGDKPVPVRDRSTGRAFVSVFRPNTEMAPVERSLRVARTQKHTRN